MKEVIVAIALMLVMAFPAFAQEETPTPTTWTTVEYVLELGDGDSIVIFGDGNTICLPAHEDEPAFECPVNLGEYKRDLGGWIFDVQGITDLTVEGVTSTWSRMILYLGDDGTWTVVWAEQ